MCGKHLDGWQLKDTLLHHMLLAAGVHGTFQKAHSVTIPIALDQVVAPALLLQVWQDYLPV